MGPLKHFFLFRTNWLFFFCFRVLTWVQQPSTLLEVRGTTVLSWDIHLLLKATSHGFQSVFDHKIGSRSATHREMHSWLLSWLCRVRPGFRAITETWAAASILINQASHGDLLHCAQFQAVLSGLYFHSFPRWPSLQWMCCDVFYSLGTSAQPESRKHPATV